MKDLLKNPDFKFFEQDINYVEFSDLFSGGKIKLDQIYHLACPTGVPNCVPLAEEIIETCSLGTKRVLELLDSIDEITDESAL